MHVKRDDAGKAKEFWATREGPLRDYLAAGISLRLAAEAIGASLAATERKARRLGIWRRQKPATEPASASEWVLAGYEGEEGLRLSGGQEIAPREVLIDRKLTERERQVLKRSMQLVAAGEAKPHPDLEKLPKLRKPAKTKGYRGFESKAAYEAHYSDERNYASEIPAMEAYSAEADAERNAADAEPLPPYRDPVDDAAEVVERLRQERAASEEAWSPTSDNELTSTECWFCPICKTMTLLVEAEAGKCCVEPRHKDCPTGLMVPPGEEGGIDADQIPPKRKRTARPKPPKLVLSEPVEAVDTKTMVQLTADEAPKKRMWDFPPPGGCLFPHGDVGRPGFGFCAEPVVATGAPYCSQHVQRVYGKGMTGGAVE